MTQFLSNDYIRKIAPSVFADKPMGVSSKYTFIPTTQVLETLAKDGWQPVKVVESRVRSEEKDGFQKHMIRLRKSDAPLVLGDSHLEIVLTNSHDGTAAFRFDAGLYRLVCANGLVVSDANFEAVRLKHVGFNDTQVLDAVHRVIENTPKIEASVKRLKEIPLNETHKLALAKAALQLRYGDDEKPIEAEQLLRVNRFADQGDSAWNTLNVIQENVMRGGLRMRRSETGRRNSTRAVQSITENLRLNKALWVLTEELAKRIAA